MRSASLTIIIASLTYTKPAIAQLPDVSCGFYRLLVTSGLTIVSVHQSGQAQIKKDLLQKEGFDFNYFTNYWKAKNGNVYLFCYEYGYRDLKDNGKYMLITWQDYMSRK